MRERCDELVLDVSEVAEPASDLLVELRGFRDFGGREGALPGFEARPQLGSSGRVGQVQIGELSRVGRHVIQPLSPVRALEVFVSGGTHLPYASIVEAPP